MKFSGKIELANLKDFFGKFSKNIAWVFFGIFLLLVILEIFKIKQSVQIILNSNVEAAPVSAQRGVRINFADYDKVAHRIEAAKTFTPSGGIYNNPFGSGQ